MIKSNLGRDGRGDADALSFDPATPSAGTGTRSNDAESILTNTDILLLGADTFFADVDTLSFGADGLSEKADTLSAGIGI